MSVAVAPIRLTDDELDVAISEVRAVRDLVHEGEYRDTLDDILADLEDGRTIDGEHADEVDRLLTLSLQSGRVRAIYGPGGEQAALKLFRRLPSGSDLAATARAVNEALGALAGRTLEQATVTAAGPGVFTLSLVAEGAELTVKLDRQGVRIGSVAL
jgi:hypothetical protein